MRSRSSHAYFSFCLLCFVVLSISSQPVKASTEKNNAEFLALHWQQPIQAILPTTNNDQINTTFAPKACAACHPNKFSDWQNSLHAKAMSVGVLVQLKMLSSQALAKHYLNDKGCMHCHAPTKTQQQSLISSLDNSAKSESKNSIHQQGVICIACHVRDEHWFGPGTSLLKKNQSQVRQPNQNIRSHGSQSHSAFQSSQFCANCHQFDIDGPSLAGKLIQNTYNEWQTSNFAMQEISCQSCHMPNKRHLFKGIHDKNMVLSGLTITSKLIKQEERIDAHLTIKNTNIGHHFPTYVTPRIILRGYQVDAQGNVLEDSLLEHEIMRAVSLDLADEYFDSRLAAGQSYRFDYNLPRLAEAKQLMFTITVEPDYFYQQFFTTMLEEKTINTSMDDSIVESLLSAKDKTDNSPYLLFSKEFLLN